MSWYRRLTNVLRPRRTAHDLDRELRFHVLERAEELQAGGMPEADALRAAQLQFGNYILQVERTRDMDIAGWLDSLLRNLRLAMRALAKSPAFSATVVLTLALGIGANSAVFSAIYAVLLRPLPFPNADRLVKLSQVIPGTPQPFVAPARLEDWNRMNDTFQAISGYYTQDESELSGQLPEKVKQAWVAPRFLQVWGVAPTLGRDFRAAEEHAGGPNAALISDRFWRRRFGGDPAAVGKNLRFGRSSVPIIGVMPPSFRFEDREVDLWMLSAPDSSYAQNREATWYTVVGRLKPGVTLERARANISAVQASLGRQFPNPDAKIRVEIEPLKEVKVAGVRRSLWIVFGSVSLLLLLACTNIAALLLSRSAARQHEIAVRFSLGASRISVAAQLLTEVLILAVAGAVMGLLVAAAAARVFAVLAKDLPRIDEIGLDWRIVLYSLACALTATLLCGIFPAIRGTRRSLAGSMAHAGRSQVSARRPLQFALVGVQVALAVTLLAGAGLLLRSFQELGRVAGGFDPEHVLTLQITSNYAETADPKGSRQRTRRLLDGLRSVPGVEAAAAAFWLPGVPRDYPLEFKSLEGRAEIAPRMMAQGRVVTSGYFAALRIPLLAGETCRDESTPGEMMVNRSFADAYMGGADVIGHHLAQTPAPSYAAPAAVVRGIVGDAREMGLEREPAPTVYWCGVGIQPGLNLLVRTHGDAMAMAESVRRKIHDIEPGRSVYGVSLLTDHISDAFAENRLRTVLLTFFALTAISLACIGLYGTLSYMVNVRRREVGLRLALGAMKAQIAGRFLGQGLAVSLLGCAGGLALASLFTRLLAGMLYGVSPWDAITISVVIALVIGVSVVASLLPAIRAARVEPMSVLRNE